MTLFLRKTIELQDDILSGLGKVAAIQNYADEKEESRNEPSYMTAVASASAVTVMKLDKEGNVILKDELQLQADSNYSNEIQVAWCDTTRTKGMPNLIVFQANQLMQFTFDTCTESWNHNRNDETDLFNLVDEQQLGSISCLTSIDGCLYTGTSKGLWEFDGLDGVIRMSLLPITVVTVSVQYLAAAHQDGGIFLYHGGAKHWTVKNETSRINSTITSLLLHQSSQSVLIAATSAGVIRILSLPDLACLSETTAHIRWITSLVPTGGNNFASAAQDGFIHMWRLAPDGQISYATSLQLDDCLITGGVAVPGSPLLILTAYDRSQVYCVEATIQDLNE